MRWQELTVGGLTIFILLAWWLDIKLTHRAYRRMIERLNEGLLAAIRKGRKERLQHEAWLAAQEQQEQRLKERRERWERERKERG